MKSRPLFGKPISDHLSQHRNTLIEFAEHQENLQPAGALGAVKRSKSPPSCAQSKRRPEDWAECFSNPNHSA
jgi:hypothetical protein